MNKKSNLNKFLTFLENDFYRSLKVMIPVMVIFLLAHIAATIFSITNFNASIKSLAKRLQQDVSSLQGTDIGTFSFARLLNSFYVLPIMFLSFGVIALYTIVLWNREWRGSSKSCYTLLTLPFKRVYVIISKIVTIFIFLGINLILQCSTLFIDKLLINIMVPKNFIRDTSIFSILTGVYRNEIYRWREFMNFLSLDSVNMILSILLAMALIVLLGLIVLLFRSFGVKGGVLGTVIFITYIFLYLFGPGIFNLYFHERIYFRVLIPLGTSILGFIWSDHLLEKKVSI